MRLVRLRKLSYFDQETKLVKIEYGEEWSFDRVWWLELFINYSVLL